MADESDSGEKTEEPSGRRKSESRKEGQVGISPDFSNVVGIIAAFVALEHLSSWLWSSLVLVMHLCFSGSITANQLTIQSVNKEGVFMLYLLAPPLLILMVVAAFFGAGCSALQTNFLWSWKLIYPKMFHINPISGIKRIFSITNLVTLLKSIAKLCIILPIGYFAFMDQFPLMLSLMDTSITALLPTTASAASYIFWRIIWLLFVLGIVDMIWQKWRNYKQLKMSKQEVKDERKAVEGDEATRRKILSIGIKRARERMMKKIPTADVVVTNPTHYAVALAYSKIPGNAPMVVAKGRGFIAQQIKKIAAQYGIPIIERKTLARALYKMAEVDQQIPYELFKAVAELLAYVYRLRGNIPFKAKTAMNNQTGDL